MLMKVALALSLGAFGAFAIWRGMEERDGVAIVRDTEFRLSALRRHLFREGRQPGRAAARLDSVDAAAR